MKHKLSMVLGADLVPSFYRLLQRGVRVEARVGCSIKAFLCEQIGLSEEYFQERVQTVFLDGKPVDDPASATIRSGSVISLSAALPGLLGATLRTGGYYASLRSQISYREGAPSVPAKEDKVVLKLFNLLTRELGPDLLKRGVWIEGEVLQGFFMNQPDRFWSGCRETRVDGEGIDPARLAGLEWENVLVFLRVEAE